MAGETLALRGGSASWRASLSVVIAVMACVASNLLAPSTALALSPSVGSKAASNVAETTATLNGTVHPNSLATKTYFEYGPTTSYGSKTAEVSVGSGSSALETANSVTGLTTNSTYHYRVVATNADGTSMGGDRIFTVGWKVEALAETGTQMKDVSCWSPSACTAVRDGGIQRWNGNEWKAQTLATPVGGSGVTAQGVSCPSASACTAVGSYTNGSGESKTLAEFWNGTEWKVQATPTPAGATFLQTRSVSCLSETECTAVGTYGSGETKAFALRWKGSEWSLQTTAIPSKETYLTSVSCPTTSFCMATGYYYDFTSGKWTPHAQRWNGSEWITKEPVKPSGANISWLYGVSCVSSSACWAVGSKEVNAGTHETQTMVQVWNGSSWALQTSPNPEASNRDLQDVSCASSTVCMAVGYLTTGSGYLPLGIKWNGSSWTTQSPPLASGSSKAMLFSTSCVASRGCAAVGQKWNASSVVVPLAEDNWRAAAPTVATTAASGIGDKTATINGSVNPNGSEAKVYFEYGTTTSYGSKTAEFNVGSGVGAVEQGAALTGLSATTTYHYRVVASNENPDTSRGSDLTFKTGGLPAASTLGAEIEKSGEAATLKGQVKPNGLSTTYQFEYGTTSGMYTNKVPIAAESAGTGTEYVPVSYKVTGLTPGKTYYYRIVATNSAGQSNGFEVSFSTPGPPLGTTNSAVVVTNKCATLRGAVEPNGQVAEYWFEYGLTTSYGTKLPVTPKETTIETGLEKVEETACGLNASTVYHFRLVAKNGFGTNNGSDKSVTTFSAATLSAKGSPLSGGDPLSLTSSEMEITGGEVGPHFCEKANISGKVSENPGSVEVIETLEMSGSAGGVCPWSTPFGLNVKYSSPSKEISLYYTTNGLGEAVLTTSKFVLVGMIYFEEEPFAECLYDLVLSGAYEIGKPLEPTLSGEMEPRKETWSLCTSPEVVSGKFAITSSGNAVEANP
jgi:hypothetical protein